MRWLLLLCVFPVQAGDFSILADTWAQDRETGFGLEYAMGDQWKPSVMVSRYQNQFEVASWYGGVGMSRSLLQRSGWDLSAGLYALYFKHRGEDATFLPSDGASYLDGDNVVMPVDSVMIRRHERYEYVAPSPALTMSYNQVGVTLSAIQLPNEDWSTALQLRITL